MCSDLTTVEACEATEIIREVYGSIPESILIVDPLLSHPDKGRADVACDVVYGPGSLYTDTASGVGYDVTPSVESGLVGTTPALREGGTSYNETENVVLDDSVVGRVAPPWVTSVVLVVTVSG